MLERAEELKQRIRETPLDERLDNAKRRIGRMCSEGRPPRMTIPVQYDDDDFYISTTLSDAQATIADLQGQAKDYQACRDVLDSTVLELTQVQQRVAQLEQERDAFESHAIDLQADHARVLGLLAQVTEIADMMLKGTECEHDVGLCSCEHRRIVKQAQRSLPAQPAQGGASKPVTTCNRHSDCDAADEKARAKGALHADHCHDDCCSECFGN